MTLFHHCFDSCPRILNLIHLSRMLCAVCMSMFLGTGAGKHHATFENLQRAGDNGCSICFHISYHLCEQKQQYLADHSLLQYAFQDNDLIVGLPGLRWGIYFSEPEMDARGYAGTAFNTYLQGVKDDLNNLDYCAVRDNFLNPGNMQHDSTGGSQAMKYAMSCLKECQESHQQCHDTSQAIIDVQGISSQESWHPRRLVDCSPQDGALHLIYGQDRIPGVGYATLSYCWGTADFFTLTLEREKEVMGGGVSLDELPLAFCEAMQVCNELGVRYLWIDSICIVQSGDDGRDWLLHAREMSRIYSACLLNIAVEHISHPNEGIFSHRHLRELIAIPAGLGEAGDRMRTVMERSAKPFGDHTSPVDLSVARGRIYELSFAMDYVPWAYVHRTKLSSRGWVLQERLLSPRTVHFSRHRIAWSCYERITAERSQSIHSNGNSGFRINKDILYPCSETCPNVAHNKRAVWWWWKYLIEDYSHRQLSFPEKDKLVALAGIMEVFNQGRNGQYLAGMFRDMIHWSLLWKVDTDKADPQKIVEHGPKSWAGSSQGFPSWSWASFNAPIRLPLPYENPNATFATSLIEVVDAKADLLDDQNPYGQMKSCVLVLRGLLVSEKEKTLVGGVYGMVDDGRYTREGHGLWFLPTMRSRAQTSCPVIHGLLLQRHCRNEHGGSWSYHRVGTFQSDATDFFTAALESANRRSLITLV